MDICATSSSNSSSGSSPCGECLPVAGAAFEPNHYPRTATSNKSSKIRQKTNESATPTDHFP
eukprot:1879415-Amphidinium_carterae.1